MAAKVGLFGVAALCFALLSSGCAGGGEGAKQKDSGSAEPDEDGSSEEELDPDATVEGDAAQPDAGCRGESCQSLRPPEPACGDGLINVDGETCDDGNGGSGDGCTANCMLEANHVCPAPGQACVSTVACADSKVTGDETCDDGNVTPGDGCAANCQLESGWSCPMAGFRCEAASCGDGIVAGTEECDFASSVEGCTACAIDDRYDCDGSGCHMTQCGNQLVERGEQCDDTNDVPFDGCYKCRKEPRCVAGVCEPVCGDGQRYKNEECDDGNLRNGDGCSSTCQPEFGFSCTDQPASPPPSVSLPIVYRDFIGQGNSLRDAAGCYDPIFDVPSPTKTIPCFHINFNGLSSPVPTGVVKPLLGDNGRPVYVCDQPNCADNPGQTGRKNTTVGATNNRDNFTGPIDFGQWYDSSYAHSLTVVDALSLARQTTGPSTGSYVFDGSGTFYPLDTRGFVAAGQEALADVNCSHNVSFTSETHFWFEYQGGEAFEFSGDDDMWVFVNGHLAIDLSGLHGSQTASFVLGADADGDGPGLPDGIATVTTARLPFPPTVNLGIQQGGVYEIVMFHAERNECGSNFKVTLKDFNRPKSACVSTCGDGKLASNEVCDAGDQNSSEVPPAYGKCASDCRSRGGVCGDGATDASGGELCDDGTNISVYGSSGCAPGCKLPAHCGDGQVQSTYEKCDDGINDGGYGECAANCVLGPRCGDGVLNSGDGEECDEGNRENKDGCDVSCKIEQLF